MSVSILRNTMLIIWVNIALDVAWFIGLLLHVKTAFSDYNWSDEKIQIKGEKVYLFRAIL